MTAFPCYSEFTCAILSISSISRLTIAFMWFIGADAVCILMTRWFPLHSSMSMKSQMKKWAFKIMQKLPCISHYCVKECKPWLFLTFCWIARTRDCRTWWKKLVYAKTYFEKLKHGLPRYQNKRQQKTKQTKSHGTI